MKKLKKLVFETNMAAYVVVIWVGVTVVYMVTVNLT